MIVLYYIRPDLLKAFFDLCEDEEEDEELLSEVYTNPRVLTNNIVPPSTISD